ncbi:similar to histidinol-phosphate aminotransferase 1, HisC [gamma proteobacterium HdN1]|nr:similar to histidinol-phosphate aminotransferase 1, HisC [gamma proteobacterium HdN1]
MDQDFLSLAMPQVQSLSPYIPGKPIEELQRELGLTKIVKLASNENPLGPSPKSLAAIEGELKHLTLYPDGNGFALKSALAERFSLDIHQITLGNGSNDLLDLVARAFLGQGREAIYSEYAFAVYPISTQAVGATGIAVPAKEYGHDLSAMLAAITPRTSVIFLANPNNPTGTWFDRQALSAFLAAVPDRVIVVLDEAYTEYVGEAAFPNGFEFLNAHRNLIVTRTFSKAYGLAGLRVGYAVSDPAIADTLNRVRQPFNVNSLALIAATAALSDDEYLQRSFQTNREGLALLAEGVRALGLDYIPSVGNFITVHFGRPAQPIYQALLREGVIVRPVANYGLRDALRISVGTLAENQYFLEALTRVLGSVHDGARSPDSTAK